ncbi:hypothetical protein B1J93_18250 [Leptospira kirschneri serovar Pomona]|uniref:Uncharacterized protein n=1 Tax=Leptospira kirschneri serovar Pomona TaxID=561005 RepID=A0A1T1DHE8_9LEPT|nr:hypothetical protein B1J93_18250 [Leptospira kirschneri serovar Pomona]
MRILELLKNSIVKIRKIASIVHSIQSNTNRSRINFSTTLLCTVFILILLFRISYILLNL